MGKNKNKCWACGDKHYPPTGKNCKKAQKVEEDVSSDSTEVSLDERDSPLSQVKCQKSVKKSVKKRGVAVEKDSFVKSHCGQSDTVDGASLVDEAAGQGVQLQILAELRSMSARLEAVEGQVGQKDVNRKPKGLKLSSCTKSKTSVKKCDSSSSEQSQNSESSDDDTKIPELSYIRSSRDVQKQIDRSLAKLSKKQSEGNDGSKKLKSKRGGPVEVTVQEKVAWPHEHILGGQTRQRVTYDQLTMPQFVQGFVKNILDEKNLDNREFMLRYLGDIMEDTSDFSWVSAKASHAVLLCEMERGQVVWSDTSRIDRIRRAHAQKHQSRQNWGYRQQEKRPWFCKNYQTGSCNFNKDHEVGGKLHRHICAYCVSQGRQLNHPERECHSKKLGPKNDQGAAHL